MRRYTIALCNERWIAPNLANYNSLQIKSVEAYVKKRKVPTWMFGYKRKLQQIASSNIPLAEDLNVIESQNEQGTPGYNPHDLAT